jgi:hypothetical protein
MTAGPVPATSAAGRQGGSVLRHLLEDGRPVRRGYPRLRLGTLEDRPSEQGWAGRHTITARRDKTGRPRPAPAQPTAPHAAS